MYVCLLRLAMLNIETQKLILLCLCFRLLFQMLFRAIQKYHKFSKPLEKRVGHALENNPN